jgi:hypothetical protein
MPTKDVSFDEWEADVQRFLSDEEREEYDKTRAELERQVKAYIDKQPPVSVQQVYLRKRIASWKAREEVCPPCKDQTDATKSKVRSYMAFFAKLPDDHPCLHCERVDERTDHLFALYSTRKASDVD